MHPSKPSFRTFCGALLRPLWVKVVWTASILSILSEVAYQVLPDDLAQKIPRAYNCMVWVGKYMPTWGWFALINGLLMATLFQLVYAAWKRSEERQHALPALVEAMKAPNEVIKATMADRKLRIADAQVSVAHEAIEQYRIRLDALRTSTGPTRFLHGSVMDPLGEPKRHALSAVNGVLAAARIVKDITLRNPGPLLSLPSVPDDPGNLALTQRSNQVFDPTLNGPYFAEHDANISQLQQMLDFEIRPELSHRRTLIEGALTRIEAIQ